jgi:hypothetical protein
MVVEIRVHESTPRERQCCHMHNYLLADRAGWTRPGRRTRNFQFPDAPRKTGPRNKHVSGIPQSSDKTAQRIIKGSCPTNHKITAGKVDDLSSLQSFLTCCQFPISLSFPTRRAAEPLQLLHCLKITLLVLITRSPFQKGTSALRQECCNDPLEKSSRI